MAGFVAEVAEVIGYLVSAATSVRELHRILADGTPDADVMVIDLFMPETDGFELIGELAERGCSSAIILVSGHNDTLLEGAAKIVKARGLRLLAVIPKPFRLVELESVLRTTYLSLRERHDP